MEKEIKKEKGRKMVGNVVSDKMNKTVVIEVLRLKKHPKYKKYFKVTRRFKAHNPDGQYKTGDKVEAIEIKPISKEKRWLVINKLN